MNGTDLLQAIGDIDERFLCETERARTRRRALPVRWIAAAAVLLIGCAAAGLYFGWKLEPIGTRTPDELVEQFGYTAEAADSLGGRELLQSSVSVEAHALSREAMQTIESHSDADGTWKSAPETLDAFEQLTGLDLLTLGSERPEPMTFYLKRNGKGGYRVGAQWVESHAAGSDAADPTESWAVFLSAVIDTNGGEIDELTALHTLDDLAGRETRRIEALGTDAELLWYCSDVPIAGTDRTNRHNWVVSMFVHDNVAYFLQASVQFGEELTQEQAFDRMAHILNRLQ